MTNEGFEIDFLTNKDNYYLTANAENVVSEVDEIDLSDIALYRVDEVSFDDQAPRKEALENVLSTMKIDGINFIYLILGDENGVNFYYGISRNYSSNVEMELSVLEIGEKILEPSIKGNFRGSHTTEVQQAERKKVIETISNMKNVSMLEGVPGSTKEDEKFQGVDRLADVMLGDRFGFMIIASPASYDNVKEIEKNLYDVYSRIVPLAKKSIQSGKNKSTSISKGKNSGTSNSIGENYSKVKNESISVTTTESKNHSIGTNSGTSTSKQSSTTSGSSSRSDSNQTSTGGHEDTQTGTSKADGKTTGGSESNGKTKTSGSSTGVSEQTTNGDGTSESTSLDYIDKKSQDWIKYLDEVIIPRLDYGMGKGIFITTSFLFSDSKPVLKKLENTAISLYSGEAGNKVPLRAFRLKSDSSDKTYQALKNFQLPCGKIKHKSLSMHESVSRSALSQCMSSYNTFLMGNWITTNELAMIAGLPQKEVVGMALSEEVEFGLNYDDSIDEKNKIYLGHLVQSGNELDKRNVYLDKKDLDKHVFISGVTGSGKTTTCRRILMESGLPFLVIEPAKTEYRIMKSMYPDLLVFTLGNENVGTPFRLNPFEFFYPYESISSRVDMIKASIEAAFDMEAAIPQIIESAIYACYEDYGWNVSTNENKYYDDPFADGVYAFPTLGDLVDKIPEVVYEQGFDTRLKNDYIGSIKARLMGLLMGSKGLMLNTKRSIDFMDIINRRVVLELEEIRNGAEKSLVMGFILTNLLQAIKVSFIKSGKDQLEETKHITLVEEAHRLLSKYAPGDNPSKKQGVETFSDMLAEIRKYGESLIIVDQIPNKLTPDVLKNTNTKIVHKIFASDDKDAIGNTIVLDKDQKEFLSNLKTGRAIVFSQGYRKALQVQIEELKVEAPTAGLRDSVYEYYADNYKKGIIINSQFLKEKPSYEQLQMLLDISKNTELCNAVYEFGCMYDRFPKTEELDNINILAEDDSLNKIMSEIATQESSAKPKKEQQQNILKKYIGIFDTEYFVKILINIYLSSNEIKKSDGWPQLKKKITSEEGREYISTYIKKYAGQEEIALKEQREYKDYIKQ